MRCYSATTGLPGYLPSYGAVFRTLQEARDWAKQEKEDFLDYAYQQLEDGRPTVRVTGDIRRDWFYNVERRNQYGWSVWQRIRIDVVELTQEEWEQEQEGW